MGRKCWANDKGVPAVLGPRGGVIGGVAFCNRNMLSAITQDALMDTWPVSVLFEYSCTLPNGSSTRASHSSLPETLKANAEPFGIRAPAVLPISCLHFCPIAAQSNSISQCGHAGPTHVLISVLQTIGYPHPEVTVLPSYMYRPAHVVWVSELRTGICMTV